jgi:thiosulfate/3-mercaptopyruvate sulfurtransferase
MIEPFVSIAWFEQHREQAVPADVRWYLDARSGRAAYDAGHLPGAVFVDLGEVLAAPASDEAGRHPLPEPDAFAAALGALGMGDHDTVVAYDDAGGVIAARLVWMLRTIGHPAAVLDGGLSAWRGPLQTNAVKRPPAQFTPQPWPAERLVSIDEVAAATGGGCGGGDGCGGGGGRGGGAIMIDARDRARYRGGPDPVDPRSGHIPCAASMPARENTDADGLLLGVNELRRRFATAGIGAGTPVISYCGSGVTACHNLLALEHAGLGPGRLYSGSWSQWSADPSRPIETNPAAEA